MKEKRRFFQFAFSLDLSYLNYELKIIKKIKEKDLRKKRLHFGLVFQDFNLFPQYDVLQNLTLAPSLLKMGTKEELEVQAREIIKKVSQTVTMSQVLSLYIGELVK